MTRVVLISNGSQMPISLSAANVTGPPPVADRITSSSRGMQEPPLHSSLPMLHRRPFRFVPSMRWLLTWSVDQPPTNLAALKDSVASLEITTMVKEIFTVMALHGAMMACMLQ